VKATEYFATLARYNVWATRRLLDGHVATLGDDEYRRDCGLFFGSVHGTLNHLLVAEQGLWWPRFAEGVSPKARLDEERERDRRRLRDALVAGAERWQPLIASWDESRFDAASRIDYTSTEGIARSLPFATTLAHVFNHGTHHRGQITAAITAMGHACPELDILWMLTEERK
jgi:uncharacterized damage-inducible protein DinB